jgi:hypothetical protein
MFNTKMELVSNNKGEYWKFYFHGNIRDIFCLVITLIKEKFLTI